jgi:hypothetical protein
VEHREVLAEPLQPADVALSDALSRGSIGMGPGRREGLDLQVLGALRELHRLDALQEPPDVRQKYRLSVSEYRLRQAQRRAAERLLKEERQSLLAALQAVAGDRVRTAAEAALQGWSEGLTGQVVHPATLAFGAGALGLPVPYVVVLASPAEPGRGRRAVGRSASLVVPRGLLLPQHPLGEASVRAWLVHRLRRLLKRQGPVRAAEAQEAVHASPAALSTLLAAVGPDVARRESEGQEWLWLATSEPEGPLAEAVARSLYGGPLAVPDLLEALELVARYADRLAVPEPAVLETWLSSQPWLVSRPGAWRLRSRAVAAQCIWRSDEVLVDACGRGEQPTRELLARLVGEGLARSGADALLARTPAIVRVRRGRYRLRASRG